MTTTNYIERTCAAFPHKWDLKSRLLVAASVGSQSHGTYMPGAHGGVDDVDVMGVFVAPKTHYIGLNQIDHWVHMVDELDIVTYEVVKFTRLLLKGNPNVLGMLWIPPSKLLHHHTLWRIWISHRHDFLSQRVYASFVGYAYSQLSRLGKPNTRGYMGKERKELFQKFGYDPKNAAHCVRLLRMGLEAIETGDLHVDRTGIDAEELKAIKSGEYSLERIERIAAEGFAQLKEAQAATELPPEPDYEIAEQLAMSTIEAMWNGHDQRRHDAHPQTNQGRNYPRRQAREPGEGSCRHEAEARGDRRREAPSTIDKAP